jgi:outer membrane protein assembly factor BamB
LVCWARIADLGELSRSAFSNKFGSDMVSGSRLAPAPTGTSQIRWFGSGSMKYLLTAAILIALSDLAMAQSVWPEFRGPGGEGRADEADLPVAIDESVVRWRTAIHGKAWSSPVVWGDQIWLTTATEDGKQMSVVGVDRKTGKVLFDKVLIENESPAFCIPSNSYASPTPAIHEGRLYVHFGSYLTACIDTSNAEVLWQRRDLACDHHRGPASSPILHEGKLYVAYDGFDVQYVVALDCKTGQTVWKRDREINYGTDDGDQKKAYGTGQIIEVDGVKQLVYPSAVATIAYNPDDGETLWTVYHKGMNASARPLYRDGLLFITNGSGTMIAVRPEGRGDLTANGIVWSEFKSIAKKASFLWVEGLIYMNSDDGVISCRDASTGKILWQQRAAGNFSASPVYAKGRLYFFGEEGEIFTVAAGPKYERLAKTQLGDGFMASPAIVDNELILRSKTELFMIANPPK